MNWRKASLLKPAPLALPCEVTEAQSARSQKVKAALVEGHDFVDEVGGDCNRRARSRIGNGQPELQQVMPVVAVSADRVGFLALNSTDIFEMALGTWRIGAIRAGSETSRASSFTIPRTSITDWPC